MELPVSLKVALDALANEHSPNALREASLAITEKYQKKTGCGAHLVTNKSEVAAYALVRMPATFGSVSAALSYTLAHFDAPLESVLDVGAGTGAASHAVAALTDATEFVCLERENEMIYLGKKLAAEDAVLSSASWVKEDITALSDHKADLVVASYSLGELTEETRRKALEKLWNATGKLLLIVEPGTPLSAQKMKTMRQTLLFLGGNLVAPCPHENPCPLGEEDWCHFVCRVARSKIHKFLKGGDAPFEDEKFSFLAFAKEESSRCGSRILRHPIKESGKITLNLCTVDGLETKIVTKKQGDLFKKARKSSCGDEI